MMAGNLTGQRAQHRRRDEGGGAGDLSKKITVET